ncbi:MAG: hypothetical protein JST87_00065 [Bacteroidetes bacterium]|nr:hypothetical protein [Bacteroidota bacterium]MBS1935406.1 hypothetical protein [Bacteroidota bacterium]
MKPKTLSAIGGWQSFFFCVGMYFVALIFSIFICSSIFYAVNAKAASAKSNETEKASVTSSGKQELASVAH